MKRLLAIALLSVVALLSAPGANAVIKYGVVGGATFSNVRNIEAGAKTGWHLGTTVQFDLPLGFAIQPSVLYNSKMTNAVEVPVSVQWGPDLLIFRPFVEVAPYVGYKFSGLKGAEYGIGLGGGLEIWRLQATCRYNWNLESDLYNYRGVTLSLAFLFGK